MEVDKSEDTKSMKKIRTKEEDNVDKLKRAALATLSAAAVKAKLLANQEEDEIRQLAIVMIEKQVSTITTFFSNDKNEHVIASCSCSSFMLESKRFFCLKGGRSSVIGH